MLLCSFCPGRDVIKDVIGYGIVLCDGPQSDAWVCHLCCSHDSPNGEGSAVIVVVRTLRLNPRVVWATLFMPPLLLLQKATQQSILVQVLAHPVLYTVIQLQLLL